MLRILLMVCAIGAGLGAGLSSAALAAEPFVGRWAMKPQACSGSGDTAETAVLVATDTSLSWFAGYCRIGKMYKAGQAVYLQAHCWGKGDVPVTLAAHGDRMQVTWNRSKLGEMRRCK